MERNKSETGDKSTELYMKNNNQVFRQKSFYYGQRKGRDNFFFFSFSASYLDLVASSVC